MITPPILGFSFIMQTQFYKFYQYNGKFYTFTYNLLTFYQNLRVFDPIHVIAPENLPR